MISKSLNLLRQQMPLIFCLFKCLSKIIFHDGFSEEICHFLLIVRGGDSFWLNIELFHTIQSSEQINLENGTQIILIIGLFFRNLE